MADSHARVRADRIREEIDIAQVLEDYGYDVRAGSGDREEQFSCDLHGDGHDIKPSARVYPDSQSWYCFACDIPRDAIATVQAIEDLEFWPAVKHLEAKYGLPPLRWDGPRESGPATVAGVSEGLRYDRTFEDDLKRLYVRLERATRERSVDMRRLLAYWEAADKVAWHVLGPRREGNGPWSDREGQTVLSKLQERLFEALTGGAT